MKEAKLIKQWKEYPLHIVNYAFRVIVYFDKKILKQRTKRKTLDKFVIIGKDKKITDLTAAQAEESTVGE